MSPLSIHALVARQPGSADNLGPFLNVVTWVLLITSALAVTTRLVTKRALGRRLDIDDVFVIAALITSVGSGVAVSIQTSNGLGRDIKSLLVSQVVAYEKSEYANRLLYISTLAFAKLSIISLLGFLTEADLHRKFCVGMSAVIALWGIVSVFVGAFQCGIDEPWRFVGPGSTCSNMPYFWRAMGAINMITDLALILFPVHVIATLQMSAAKKLTILVFFGARSLDVIVTGVQLAYTSAFSSSNPTYDLWKWTLTAQIIECITILTSCVPYLRPLLEALPSGLYGTDEIRRRGTPSELGYSRSKSASYKLSNQSSTIEETKTSRPRRSNVESGFKRFIAARSGHPTSHSNSASGLPGGPRRPDGHTDVEISGPTVGDDRKWETESTGSQAKIMKTTVVSAAWEEAERRSREASSDEIREI